MRLRILSNASGGKGANWEPPQSPARECGPGGNGRGFPGTFDPLRWGHPQRGLWTIRSTSGLGRPPGTIGLPTPPHPGWRLYIRSWRSDGPHSWRGSLALIAGQGADLPLCHGRADPFLRMPTGVKGLVTGPHISPWAVIFFHAWPKSLCESRIVPTVPFQSLFSLASIAVRACKRHPFFPAKKWYNKNKTKVKPSPKGGFTFLFFTWTGARSAVPL